jgi:membrane-bound lytic murein transglycosylase D
MSIQRLIAALSILSICILTGCSVLPPAQQTSAQMTSIAHAPNYQTRDSQPTTSLWTVIGDGYQLDHHIHQPKVQYYIRYFQSRRNIVNIIFNRAKPFLYLVVQQIRNQHLPTEIALLPMIESGFNLTARSPAGAVGLWQLMPGTAARFNVQHDETWFSGRQSLAQSTDAALSYLTFLVNRFDGNWLLAIAAYNSGEGTVSRAIRQNLSRGLSTDFWSLRLPKETQDYVPKLLALAIIVEHPERYGFTLPQVPNRPLIATVLLPRQVSLQRAARYAGISLDELQTLNPAYTQLATPPSSSGTYYLVLPIDRVMRFEMHMTATPESEHTRFIHYTVKRGDTLNKIALYHGTSVAVIRRLNELSGNLIRSGQVLIVPINSATGRNRVYYVKKGDTLSHIARDFGVTVSQLLKWNHLKRNSILKVGQSIVIY